MRFEKSQDPANTVRGLARAVELLQELSPGIRLVGGLADQCKATRAAAADPAAHGLAGAQAGQKRGPRRGARHSGAAGVRRVRRPHRAFLGDRAILARDEGCLGEGRSGGRGRPHDRVRFDRAAAARRADYRAAAPTRSAPSIAACARSFADEGFTEVYNYSFVAEADARAFGMQPEEHVMVANPIAPNQSLLRMSLLPELRGNVLENAKRFDAFRLFEIGREIHKQTPGLPREIPHLAAAIYSKDGDGAAGLFEMKRAGRMPDAGRGGASRCRADVRASGARGGDSLARRGEWGACSNCIRRWPKAAPPCSMWI